MSTETLLLAAERAAVADTCRRLSGEGLVVGTAGNVSVRVGDLVAISPSGVDYDVLEAHHVGVHKLDGTPVDAPLAPSSELPLHLEVYARSGGAAASYGRGDSAVVTVTTNTGCRDISTTPTTATIDVHDGLHRGSGRHRVSGQPAHRAT